MQNIILNKRTLEILFRIGCPETEIINVLKTGAHASTGDNLIDDLLDELVVSQTQNAESKPEQPEPVPTGRGGNHNPTGNNQYSDIETDNKKEVFEHIVANIGNKRKDLILITEKFSCNDFEVFNPYITEMPENVIKSVENWLRKVKLNESVSVEFIIKQFFNFAKRSNVSVFK